VNQVSRGSRSQSGQWTVPRRRGTSTFLSGQPPINLLQTHLDQSLNLRLTQQLAQLSLTGRHHLQMRLNHRPAAVVTRGLRQLATRRLVLLSQLLQERSHALSLRLRAIMGRSRSIVTLHLFLSLPLALWLSRLGQRAMTGN
jgi:hypothetical protein